MKTHSRYGDADAREDLVEKAFFHLWPEDDRPERCLAAGRFRDQFIDQLRRRGVWADRWTRWSVGQHIGSPWPDGPQVDGAILRLPKSKSELEFALQAITTRLKPEHPLWVIGANDEGLNLHPKS